VIRTDVFVDRKGIHVKLDKDVHAGLRSRLFYHNLSMQEVFNYFAKLIVSDDPRAIRLVEALVSQRLKEQLGELTKKRRSRQLNELDSDAVYNMIESPEEQDEPV